jgi:multimeric flavodoxin WrbA
MREADGIILGSPVYFSDITPVLKALIDRSGRVGRAELKSYLLGIGAQIPRGFEPREAAGPRICRETFAPVQ